MPRKVIADWVRKPFPTTSVAKLMPQMPYVIPDKAIKVRSNPSEEHLRQIFSHQMRLNEISKSVTKLIDQERVEFSYNRGWEVRNYTERLIAEAMRYGDCHKPTMQVADFYLKDKTLIHKLFKVLVPRYINYTTSFTAMHILPMEKIDWEQKHFYVSQKVLIELKGNPYPKIINNQIKNSNLLHNILLTEASKDFYKMKTLQKSEQQQLEVEEQTREKEVD